MDTRVVRQLIEETKRCIATSQEQLIVSRILLARMQELLDHLGQRPTQESAAHHYYREPSAFRPQAPGEPPQSPS
jgi:hypothetical protein